MYTCPCPSLVRVIIVSPLFTSYTAPIELKSTLLSLPTAKTGLLWGLLDPPQTLRNSLFLWKKEWQEGWHWWRWCDCADGHTESMLFGVWLRPWVKMLNIKMMMMISWGKPVLEYIYAVLHIQEIFCKGLHGTEGVLQAGDWQTGRRFFKRLCSWWWYSGYWRQKHINTNKKLTFKEGQLPKLLPLYPIAGPNYL